MTSQELISNVVIGLIVVAIVGLSKKTFRLAKKLDAMTLDGMEGNVAYRAYATANAVSNTVMGCAALLAALIICLFSFYLRIFDLQLASLQINHNAISLLSDVIAKQEGADSVVISQLPDAIKLSDSRIGYLAASFAAWGLIFVGYGQWIFWLIDRAVRKRST